MHKSSISIIALLKAVAHCCEPRKIEKSFLDFKTPYVGSGACDQKLTIKVSQIKDISQQNLYLNGPTVSGSSSKTNPNISRSIQQGRHTQELANIANIEVQVHFVVDHTVYKTSKLVYGHQRVKLPFQISCTMNHVETELAECSYFVRVIFILLYVKQKMKSDLIF